ncbi:hypothetical protein NUW54_g7373 [Trametes sanguinea]|uniref:Uncharacterized protein n=1 Tax=Trametes sanguinea TaxID=158606 RepID=A0ACC1PPD4_9APHY|nr:hypothetical protein NUW54_g7373 [Trametes sanguinea]
MDHMVVWRRERTAGVKRDVGHLVHRRSEFASLSRPCATPWAHLHLMDKPSASVPVHEDMEALEGLRPSQRKRPPAGFSP